MIKMHEYMNMLNGYRDRVARIALFDVFYQLESKLQKDDQGRPIDFFGVGLLGLLFFFENMLMRNQKTGIRELAAFLKKMMGKNIAMDDDGYVRLSKQLVEVMRPASGKRRIRFFYNYETGEPDQVEYALLKAEHWDADNNIQYYALAEEGLELIFATKEYFSEFQISISQLVLRKQLEKGEFSGALRQVDEMRISVHTIKEKMLKIKHDVQRNIISDDTYERYKEIIEDINRRLTKEHDEFNELRTFIKATKNRLNASQTMTSDRESKALDYIVRIDNELEHVHYLHASLFNESIELKTTAIEAAGESLYYSGVTSFNFDQEITRKMMTAPLPFETGKALATPFLTTKKFRTWSLLTVFEPQVVEHKEMPISHGFMEVQGDYKPEDLLILQQVYKFLLSQMMKDYGNRTQIALEEILKKGEHAYFNTREFFDLWIMLHQRSPISIKSVLENEEDLFHPAFESCFSNFDSIEVVELSEDIDVQTCYTVKNMILNIGGKEDHE
ncbi:replicative DNA helicase [Petrocella sp. FN5]|uniref:replicative DNA helicase n=1 Tax=Petrocella sp. FN5 TaxID=3032002 RepID=UPI0023DB958A|nr:replicative DNA helicase [Petrocella sp. FN5]MDF1616236.1 replicative DNA helicase [Petrocella sp. FN5]